MGCLFRVLLVVTATTATLGAGGVVAFGNNELRINNANELIEFSKNVNSGTNYKGITVFLNSDIDFIDDLSNQFEPIGNENNYFSGVFDGQGHKISNLKTNFSSSYVGLFGYSTGAAIKNVVIDETCSFVGSFEIPTSAQTGIVYVGGLIDYCSASDGPCTIENSVNMGSVTFSGGTGKLGRLYLGGVAGELFTSNHESFVKNCANYGPVTNTGRCGYACVGGIAGRASSESTEIIRIHNCLNYGALTVNGTVSNDLYIGGISGHNSRSEIVNCVNAGIIASKKDSVFIGSISGEFKQSFLSRCYWSGDSTYGACGTNTLSTVSGSSNFSSSNFELGEAVSVGEYTGNSLINALNACSDRYALRDYSRWALNKGGNTVSFKINREQSSTSFTFIINSRILLLPSLANDGSLWFDGWYTDSACTKLFKSSEFSGSAELYGKWGENARDYTITFDTRGGTAADPITGRLGSVVSLPRNLTRDNSPVLFWKNEYGEEVPWDFTVPARNVTLYAVWPLTRIGSAEDLVDFSRVVNYKGKTYSGTTVFLESDIDFTDELSRQFEPIGNDEATCFLGTFDGQGHTISNLKVKFLSLFFGLIGYSNGTTIKNVVIDDSCSFVNHYSHSSIVYVSTSGVIGCCSSNSGPCTIENAVNMASVTFSGRVESGSLFLGGIVGHLNTLNNESFVRNCANYGSIILSGYSKDAYIGGIMGKTHSELNENTIYIQNCLNYGDINASESTKNDLYLGGISGYSHNNNIENCVSAGNITSSTSSTHIGSIVGDAYISSITHSFWTSDVGYSTSYEFVSLITDREASQVEVTADLLRNLSAYSSNKSWNGWLFNPSNASVSLRINRGKGFTVRSQIILLPSPVGSSERSFIGWYSDESFGIPFDSSEVVSETTLYGLFCGSDYTVSFDANGGNELSTKEMVVECNGTYGTLPEATRAGFTLTGWFTDKNGGIKAESGGRVINFSNHTLYAHWKEIYTEESSSSSEISSDLVRIVFGVNDMTEERAREIIEKYVGVDFTIARFENNSDETVVVIKFNDAEAALSFVENVRASSEASKNDIKKIGFIYGEIESFSPVFYPILAFGVLACQ